MPQITITKLAAEKIIGDPKFLRSTNGKPDGNIPLLYYYQRSYSTSKDGTVTEYGDGFMLSFVNKTEVREAPDIMYENVTIADGVDILVGGPKSILSKDINIDWSNAKFTLGF